jgi:hypothetical protein
VHGSRKQKLETIIVNESIVDARPFFFVFHVAGEAFGELMLRKGEPRMRHKTIKKRVDFK